MIEIWAPHGDDEIIGCFSVLKQHKDVLVYFGKMEEGCIRSSKLFGFDCEIHPGSRAAFSSDIVYAPDPFVDFHPEHQKYGQLALRLFRADKIKRLIFYTTTMLAPCIWEVPNPQDKRDALDHCYPEKADLWKYDHKWFLFEGYWEMLWLNDH